MTRRKTPSQLEYTDRVIKEVTRLHSLPVLMRRTITPVEIGGFSIRTDTEVAFSLYALHQDPRFYPEPPEHFNPDRWLPEVREDKPRETYSPFGAGNRKCIGDVFSRGKASSL